MKDKKYYLFSSELHEEIKFGFVPKTIDKVKRMWAEGKTSNEICKKLRLKPVELALIIMDLDYAEQLETRAGGFFGVE